MEKRPHLAAPQPPASSSDDVAKGPKELTEQEPTEEPTEPTKLPTMEPTEEQEEPMEPMEQEKPSPMEPTEKQ